MEVIARAAMSFHHEAKTKDRVASEVSEDVLVKVGVHQRSVFVTRCSQLQCFAKMQKMQEKNC